MATTCTGLLPEALVIDLPEVDAQHEEIFVRLEALKAACFDANANCLDEFERLLRFFEFHFATEEELAVQAGLDFSVHRTAHCDNLRVLVRAFDEVRSGRRDGYSFLRYVESWFERHIAHDDKPFAASLQMLRKSPRQLARPTSQPSL
jgi:hemerythrin